MPARIPKSEKRTLEQLREHYLIEKELAEKLRNASRTERKNLYSSLYDELFRRVPLHPQLAQKEDAASQQESVSRQMRLIRRYLNADSVFLEVGAGDCSLSREVSKYVRKVYAVDVSHEITKGEAFPPNLELVLTDGSSIPVPRESVTLAYSARLMEHLHPDDASEQLKNIYSSLASGGKYICITPNRLSGPYDISRYFDDVATGFHLKEYTFTELSQMFRSVGFSRIGAYAGGKGVYLRVPVFKVLALEQILGVLPFSLSRALASTLPLRALLGITIVGAKQLSKEVQG